ncbi:FAD-dependent monooxygenase [Streptomyces scopuliridis]|uniref:FAD-dependent monooxygenase n=1 Tax=Streptomyces scopuliridis TaxID=452529 RepID=UPI0035DA3033
MSGTVIVAGAGPAGLMLAGELGLAGIETIVVERAAERDGQSRALGLHARALEALDLRGPGDTIRAGDPMPWPRTHFAFHWLDVAKLDEREYIVVVPQARTEQVLAEHAVGLGVDIRRGQEVVGVEQDDSGVTVTVRSAAGEETIRADFLVGCDGGNSAVARLAGFDFRGDGKTYYGLWGDVEVPDGEQFDAGLHPTGLFGAIPIGPGLVRIMTTEFDRPSVPDEEPATLEELRASIRKITGKEVKLGEVRGRLHRFDNATKQAEQYRLGRVLLAGDAAHAHFPSGAQGLNTGIQDALNLGWKLAAHLRGGAPAGLLDTYHDERHPVGRRACLNAEAQVALMYPLDRVAPLRELFGGLVGFTSVTRHLNDMVTGINTVYPMEYAGQRTTEGEDPAIPVSPLLGRPVPDLKLTTADGERIGVARTLHAGRGVLLDLSQGAARPGEWHGWADRIDVVSAEAAGQVAESVLLIRPDGYVAWAGPADAAGAAQGGLRAALTTWFGEPSAL